jgi:diguanylate cyclase (GGDEF)-like protein
MKHLRMVPAVRISLGLALITMMVLLGLPMLGLLPSPHMALYDVGQHVSESLALAVSLAVQVAFVVYFLLIKKKLRDLKPSAVVSKIEKQNTHLQQMLASLKKSHDEICQQNRALQVLANQDPLTGCLNRHAFFERFEMEFNRAQRYTHDLSCIMVDIDHFKLINDKHGHPVGDKVLQKVSNLLQACLRDSDVICRYGGEEFCLILPECGAAGALRTAERIRLTIASKTYLGIKVTISLGASSLDTNPGNFSELISQADKALYDAKAGGRNGVSLYREAIDRPCGYVRGADDSPAPERTPANVHIPHHVVNALMLALEHRDGSTAEHSRQVGDLCVAAAQGLMSINDCAVIEIAGQLHDIGKLGVPDAILLKPEPLTEEEWEIMRNHERRSVDVIASTFLSPELVDVVKHHSAWFDGHSSDDPTQPKGTDIPLGARILAIADAFHSMVSRRPYRRTRSYEDAFEELRRCAGTQFDPTLVDHFIEVVRSRDESRRADETQIPNSIRLEIGREVEKLFVAVNTSSLPDLALLAEQLVTKATKYDLGQIADVAEKIEKAAAEKWDQQRIVQLASELMPLCNTGDGNVLEAADEREPAPAT